MAPRWTSQWMRSWVDMFLCPWRGPRPFASRAEQLIRLFSVICCAGLTLVACSSSKEGPPPPRPVPSLASTTTTSAPNPTTTAPETLDSSPFSCETAFCLVYHISPAATWSDGDQVTAADFAHTVEVHQDQGLTDAANGYGTIENVEIIDDKTLLVSLTAPFGAWQSLF